MRLRVRVVPRAKKQRIEKEKDGLKVYLTEPATEQKANKKLIEILADHFHTKKYNITIVKGKKQRDKIVEINESC
ncbi:MAG: DUF167 domain-containing protein [Candidatus Omnitrophota bacterium]|nr:MAG: DUF167 domain-containing protein [Candidatus Omnitrophota bacterium]